MAMSNAKVAGVLRSRCNLVVADTSPGRLERGLVYLAVKTVKVLRSMCVLAVHARRRDVSLYISADAGLGIFYAIAIVTLARLLDYEIFVHHHSFAHIDRRTIRMAVLARGAGSRATHIFLCPDMQRRYRDHYTFSGNALVLSNAAHINPATRVAESRFNGLRLGHLGNLDPMKGLDDVLETTRRLLALDVKARLVLAGPVVKAKYARKIEQAITEFGEALDYRGLVHGEEKERFYRDIDVFLLPTRYVHETQPTVILEAMSVGVPCISYARGCVADDLSRGGGVAVPTSTDFVRACLPILIDWERNRDRLLDAGNKALARARELKSEGEAGLARFIDAVVGMGADPEGFAPEADHC